MKTLTKFTEIKRHAISQLPLPREAVISSVRAPQHDAAPPARHMEARQGHKIIHNYWPRKQTVCSAANILTW